MVDIWFDVDTALSEVPVNLLPLVDDGDFKNIEGAVVYNAAGLALNWHFVTTAGAYTVTAVTPTDTGGNYDWVDPGTSGVYTIEIPASGGASINNDTEGFGWFTGVATGILPWRSAVYGFRAAAINNALIDGATIDVNVTAISGDSTAADNLEAACDGGTYNVGGGAVVAASVTGAVGSVTGAVGSVTGNVGGNVAGSVASVTGAVGSVTGAVGSVAAGGITAASIATDAIDADALKADALAEIADAVWDEVVTTGAHDTATFAGAGLLAAASAGDPWATAIPGSYGAGTAGLLLGTTIPAAIDAVDNYVDTEIGALATTIGAAGAGLSAVPWNAAWDAEVQSECTDALNAYDPPTKAEVDSSIAAGDDAVLAVLGTAAGASLAADIAAVKAETAAIVLDTGTTLDTLIKDIPTNAELTTALAGADDAVLAAITAAHSTTDGKIDTVDNLLDTEVAAILADTALIEKWIIDKLVGTDNGDGTVTYVLYDTDGTTPLKTWIHTTATGTRAAAT